MIKGLGSRPRNGRFAAVLAVVLGLLASGCASTSMLPGQRSGHHVAGAGQGRPPANPAQLAVVRHWAAQLRAGNLRGAAAYFHLPSRFDDGVEDTIRIQTLTQAVAANSTLSCGAEVISAFRRGALIDVLFRLTARAGPGGGKHACGSGIGQTARTEFLIRGGQIVEWLRAPSLPGDPGVPGGSQRSPKHGGGQTTGAGSLPA